MMGNPESAEDIVKAFPQYGMKPEFFADEYPQHRVRITKPFYDRFTPAISTSDFTLRSDHLDEALDFLAVCHA